MPNYHYHCDGCGHDYEEFRWLSQGHPESCPSCLHAPPRQVFAGGRALGVVYGSPTTVGQLADQNSRRMGREAVRDASPPPGRAPFTGKLPDGARAPGIAGATPPWRDGSLGIPPLEKPLDIKGMSPAKINEYVATGNK